MAHLTERGYQPDTLAHIALASELVTFPLWGFAGKMVGYQRYDWKAEKTRSNQGRYFTWVSDLYKEWGWAGYADLFNEKYASLPVFVTEGIWNKCKVNNAGFPCIATLTATLPPSTIQCIRYACVGRPLIALCDNDESGAGMKISRWCNHHFITPTPYKDVGDMEQGEATQYVRRIANVVEN